MSQNKKQMIATCDKNGNIKGEIERWEAHEEGILHRAFTLALIYKDSYILQHRKHACFNGVFDITSSSHQLMSNGKLEDTIESARKCLFREWKIRRSDILGEFKHKGAIYYEAPDPKSIYTEHEICDILEVRVRKIPEPNYEFAYGSSLATKVELANRKSRIYSMLAPWVKVAIKKNLI